GKSTGCEANVDLSQLDGTDGFKLAGLVDQDRLGNTVSAAGDVNGDGIDDLVVAATFADEGGTDRGAAYVVFGTVSGFNATVSLSGLNGTNGFKLSGAADN